MLVRVGLLDLANCQSFAEEDPECQDPTKGKFKLSG